MNRLINTILLSLLFMNSIPVSAQELSDQGEVFLITCDPGKEVYSVFGHSAIWIRDPEFNIDYVYNYGLFDFNTPNFYMKFVKGKLLYQLGRTNYQGFIQEYIESKRSVYIQKIYLTTAEKETLFNILEINNRPENRDYLYDFFYNNCSSKIIDQFDSVLKDKSSIQHLNNATGLSFRKALKPYMKNNPWVYLGMDIGLGLPSDKIMTIRESMFLPLNLMNKLNDGLPPHLSGEPVTVYEGETKQESIERWPPSVYLWLILLTGIIISTLLKSSIIVGIFDNLLFVVTGLVSFLVAFLWFGSDHQSTNYNFNIIWAFPLNLLFIARSVKWFKPWYDNYLKFYGIVQIILLVTWAVLPQDLNNALIPVVILLAFRSLDISGVLPGWVQKRWPLLVNSA